jgi:hypothetical protein
MGTRLRDIHDNVFSTENLRNSAVNPPKNCAMMNSATSDIRIPENVLVNTRAIVTAGFALKNQSDPTHALQV